VSPDAFRAVFTRSPNRPATRLHDVNDEPRNGDSNGGTRTYCGEVFRVTPRTSVIIIDPAPLVPPGLLEWCGNCSTRSPRGRAPASARPRIICLCGSTRFEQDFRRVAAELTLGGAIVVKPDVFMNDGHADKAHLPPVTAEVKQALDALHFRKIDLADEVLVLNIGGYVGESTRREIDYARGHGKPVRYLVDERITA
jgi:hypothetical protein